MSEPTNPHNPPPPPGGENPGQAGGYQDPVQQPPQGGYQQPAQPPQGGYQQPGQPMQGGYQQPAPPYAGTTSKVGQPGDLADRFFARLIDHVILFAVNMVIVGFLIISMLMNQSAGTFGLGSSNFLSTLISSVLAAALYLGYFAFLESSRGQTIGKMVLKLETRGADGGRPSMEESVKRNIWVAFGLLGIIPIIGGLIGGLAQLAAVILIAVGISGDAVGRRGWHDKFAGTQVVKIG